ncbi:MAG: hypothetical protein KatS3mg035_2025 [Bacteroidia bacterium]|nr:MAG: hypothetical protein KatS3mg035_2025 [Bacteroidia bacterium]
MRLLIVFFLWTVGHLYAQNVKYIEKIEVSTYAGNGIRGYKDGVKGAAMLASPNGITMDKFGNLFIGDSDNNSVRKVDAFGNITTVGGNGIEGYKDGFQMNSQFNWPTGVCADKNGNIYVADYWNHCIRKISSYGIVTTYAGVPGKKGYKDGNLKEALFNCPISVFIDFTDNLYVLDSRNNCVRKILNDGKVITYAGSPTAGFKDGYGKEARFSGPVGMCMDRYGNLYVVDSDNQAIRRVLADSKVETILDANFTGYKDSTEGKKLQFFHGMSSGGGICSGPMNLFYIADGGSNCIFKVDVEKKVISVIAGNGKKGFKDGDPKEAMFNRPVEICMDLSNNLYVADFENHVVRKIEIKKIKIEEKKDVIVHNNNNNHKPNIPPAPKVYYLTGRVIETEFSKPVQNVELIIQELGKPDEYKKVIKVTNGTFKIPIHAGTFNIFVKQPGFMPYQEEIKVPQNKDYEQNIYLVPIKLKAKAVMRNIYFAPNSSTITIDALEGLDKLVEFMKINPNIEIQISGHTDIGSTQEFNKQLSEARAKSVRDYLVQMGIDSKRITYVGYGNTKPIADNKTKEGRAINRRIEIEITKM